MEFEDGVGWYYEGKALRGASVNVRVWSRALSVTRNSIKGFRFWDHCVSPVPFARNKFLGPLNEVCFCPVTNRDAI